MQGYVPAPNSGLAITALVLALCSLVVCCPAIAPLCALLAIIFAVTAFGATRGGRRRGRGLAIAGLIIGLLTLPLGIFATYWLYNVAIETQVHLAPVVKATMDQDWPTVSKELYQLGSPRFQSQVSEEQLLKFLRRHFVDSATMQRFELNEAQPVSPTGRANERKININVKLSNGETVTVGVVFSADVWGHTFFEDLLVKDESLLKNALPEKSISSAPATLPESQPGSETP
ncbi:MAG: hypothetical protein HJJLKODD_00982 [Phycisphaerae bacterium]|nr:hypothetical protein [Phycisphaerae bacterium]